MKKKKKANTDHIAHQVSVSGTGKHKNKKAYDRKKNKKIARKHLTKYR